MIAPRAFVLGLALSAQAADAETPMTAREFENYTTGQTLTYAQDGVTYGIEEYLEGRRVRWSFLGDECQDGTWYPFEDMICFVYDQMDAPQCWSFYRDPGGLRAVFRNDPLDTTLYQTQKSDEPLICLGPKIGV